MLSQANAHANRTPEVKAAEWNVIEVRATADRKLHVRFAGAP